MIRRPPRSTQSRSSAASDVYKRQDYLLRESDGADAEDLSGKERVRGNARHHDFRDTGRLLLEDAAHDRLSVDHDRKVEQKADREAEQHARHARSGAAALRNPF